MTKIIPFLLLFLSGCAGEKGFLVPDDMPGQGAIKRYCFDGAVSLGGNAPFVAGSGQGKVTSHGVVWYGDKPPPDEAIIAIAKQNCEPNLEQIIERAIKKAMGSATEGTP